VIADWSSPLSRKNTTGAARSREQLLGRWPKVCQASMTNLRTNHIMTTKNCFFTDANRAEISMVALAVGTSLPTQASVASWPSLKGESGCFCVASHTWLLDLVTAPSMQDVEPRCLPSVAFTPSGPLVYQWQKDRRSPIRPETPSKYDGRRRDRP
jgi:hypothetical protein